MSTQAQASVTAPRPEIEPGGVAESEVNLEHVGLPDFASEEALEQLKAAKFKDSGEAVTQVRPLLELVERPKARSIIVDALRTGFPPQFALSEVRIEAFNALAVYAGEREVASICVEEFQVRPKDEASCAAAGAALKGQDLKQHPRVLELCRRIVSDGKDSLASLEISAGLTQALLVLRESPSRVVERRIIEEALEAYKLNSPQGGRLIEALAALGTKDAVAALCDMASSKIMPKWEWQWHGDDSDLIQTQVMVSILGAMVSGAIIGGLAHWVTPQAIDQVVGTVSGILGGLITGAAIAFLPNWVDDLKDRPNLNPQMKQTALKALARELPSERAEAIVAAALNDEACEFSCKKELAVSLRGAKHRSTLKTLIAGLRSTNEKEDAGKAVQYKSLCLEALSGRREPEALEAILDAKSDYNPEIRVKATVAAQNG